MSYEIYNAHPNIWIWADGTETDLNVVTSIEMLYTDIDGDIHEITIPASEFLTQTSTKILFTIEDACEFVLQAINVNIVGTNFSGTVELGPDTVIIANGSGIYRLVSNQTHDTVYVDSTVDNVTAEIKIPDPSFKTGHIDG